MSRNTIAKINLAALRHNLEVVRNLAPLSKVVCVIKADGYGHGIGRVAHALTGADVFAVATPGEARSVRDAGWDGRLLLLEGFANIDDFNLARELGLELVIHQAYQLELLKRNGCSPGQKLWIKLDSGMHRLGFPIENSKVLIEEVKSVPGAGEPILMTHFACADDPSLPMTQNQINLFDSAVSSFDYEQSLANSAAIINFNEASKDYVRPGIMLYGISPNNGKSGADYGLKPAMTLSCELLAVNRCRKGDHVGYGASFTCEEDMTIGVAAIGYGDGYPRHLRSGTPVLLNGRRAKLAGRVSMDLITLDLRGHHSAEPGDEVVLWGDNLPVEEVAVWADAIPYELVCGVTGRVDRIEV
ncbi:MAG: alanine racemase [Lysobacterales bacterium]|jgi:alanine racemase